MPYLIQGLGVRIEHLAIYAFGIWGLFTILVNPPRSRPTGLFLAVAFVGSAAMAVLSTVFGPVRSRDLLQVISELDHYARPVALALGVAGWSLHRGPSSIRLALRHVCVAILVLLGLNTLLSLSAGVFDIRPLVAPFRSNRVGGLFEANTVELFLDFGSQGRVTGIFGLPFDAGVAYSVGLFAWGYLAKARSKAISAWMYVALVLVLVGGLLSVSKAFILAGIPLFVLYWLWGSSLGRFISARGLLVVFAAVVFLNALLTGWSGFDYIESLIGEAASGSQGVVDALTAGRFGGEGSSIGGQISDLWNSGDVLFGVGLGTPLLLDSAYFAFLAQGGVIALAAYLVLIVTLGVIAWRSRAVAPQDARLLFVLAVFIAGAGIGAPVASVIRASTILWLVVLMLLAVVIKASRAGQAFAVKRAGPSRTRSVTGTDA